MVAFSFVGWSNSGKTTVIANLTTTLVAQNKRVAALKKVAHGFNLQPQGKDSFLFRQAGASPVYLLNDNEIVTIEPNHDQDVLWRRIAAANNDCDYILLEGFRPHGAPLIEVFNARLNNSLKFSVDSLIAVVGDRDPGCNVPFFLISDIDGIIRFMEAYHG